MTRRAVAGVLLSTLAIAGCTGGTTGRVAPASTTGSPTRTAPRWEQVTRLSGTGDLRTAPFTVRTDALQWRVTAACEKGRLRVGVPEAPEPLTEPTCPGRAFGFSIHTGRNALVIVADGPWTAVIHQQLETPITEMPLRGMGPQARLAEGRFYGIDQKGAGTAALYRLENGRMALRFEAFSVTANLDLFVWASAAAAPRTSADAFHAPHVQLGPLKATAGSQNYVLPEEMRLEQLRSVVVWCEPVRTAYAAAEMVAR